MNKKIGLNLSVLAAFLLATSSLVHAEAYSFQKILGGTIAQVSANSLRLTSKDSDQNSAEPVDLEVNDKTKLKDVQAITDLKQGDEVQVKYTEESGKKVAIEIEKGAAPKNTADTNDTMQK